MPVDVEELLCKLSEANGVSGYESEVQDIVMERFSRHADEVRCDKMGSVIALKRGVGTEPRRSIMLAAHMDEIGLVVTNIKKDFIQFDTVGGFDPRALVGQLVTVLGRQPMLGVISSRPPHVLSAADRDKVVPVEDLFIDVGSQAGSLKEQVRVGDLITIKQRFLRLNGDMASGKAFDDRAGVASLVVCLEELAHSRHEWDVYAVATVQEELGLRGAITSAYGLAPDLGIAVDVTFGHQPGVPEFETFAMGKGPAVGIGPNIHQGMYDKLVQSAKDYEIPYVTEPLPGGSGTDAWAIQVTREGVPTCLLSIPVRYMHTPVETVNLKDVTRTGRLMAAFIAQLNDDTLDDIAWKLPDSKKREHS
jgi:putative aminopeptidase FrvX